MSSDYLFSAISGLLIGSFVFIWHASLVILLIQRSFFGTNNIKFADLSIDGKALQLSGIIAFSLISMAGLSVIILNIYKLQFDASLTIHTDPIISALRFVLKSCLALSYIAFYFFLVCRLHSTFKHSTFAIKTWIIKIHFVIGLLTVPVGLIAYILVLNGADRFTAMLTFFSVSPLILLAFVHLFYAFNNGLFQIVLQQRQSIISEKVKLSDNAIRLMVSVRKHSMIGVFVILLGFLAMIAYFFGVYVEKGDYAIVSTYHVSKAHFAVVDIIIVCCLDLACLTMFLGFAVNDGLYGRLCKVCDHTFALLCLWIVHSRINKGIHVNVEASI